MVVVSRPILKNAKKVEINHLQNINLLDKLNLYFKVPSAIDGLVEFDEIEQSFIDRIEKIKKFDGGILIFDDYIEPFLPNQNVYFF